MKLLKRIKYFLFGTPTEIELVEAALNRYRDRTQDIECHWRASMGPCCPSCFGREEYRYLCDKIERVEKWLEILKKRKAKNDN